MPSLMWCCRNGHVEEVRLLLGGKASVNKADKEGTTPLITAAFLGHVSIVRLLLQQKAEVNQANNVGMTALMGAITAGHESVVKMLRQETMSRILRPLCRNF